MSAAGPSRHFERATLTSGLPPRTEINRPARLVRFVPNCDIVAKDGVIPQYHRAGLKKYEAIEATTHTTKTPIATRPTCLDIRSILACKTSASTEALSVVCSLACSKVPDLSADQRVGSMIYTFAIPQPLNEH
jgi:hypothetical protein